MSTSQQPADAAKPADAGQPLRQSVRALEMPPEVAQEVEAISRRRWYGRRSRKRKVLEADLLLQYHYGGQYVGFLPTPEDYLVVAAGDPDGEAFKAALAALPPDERRLVVFLPVSLWDDPDCQLLSVGSDED